MALKDLLRPTPTPAAERPAGITCPKYVRGEGKRCLHFKGSGACALPDEFMCVEWLKRNGPPTSDAPPAPARPATSAPSAPASPPETPIEIECLGELRGLTTEDIASFKALGVEVRLKSEAYGDLWLVPAYTGQARKALTPEHAAKVVRVLTAFPGSQVISFEKHSQPERPERLPRRP